MIRNVSSHTIVRNLWTGTLLGAAALAAVIVMFPAAAFAEPIGSTGEMILPVGDKTVQLASADIRIVMSAEKAKVSAAYYLMNDGDIDSVTAGIQGTPGSRWDDFHVFGETELPVETHDEALKLPAGRNAQPWKTFRIPLAPRGSVTEVVIQYTTTLGPGGSLGIEDTIMSYVLRTGARWNGLIDDIKMTVYLDNIPAELVTDVEPEDTMRDNNRIMWHFTDCEPSEDVKVAVMDSRQYFTLNTALTMLKMQPDNAHAHFLAGAVYFLRSLTSEPGKKQQAKDELEKAVSLHPRHSDARFFLAALYYLNGDKGKADVQIKALVAADPEYTCDNKLFPEALASRIPSLKPAEWPRPSAVR